MPLLSGLWPGLDIIDCHQHFSHGSYVIWLSIPCYYMQDLKLEARQVGEGVELSKTQLNSKLKSEDFF